MFQHHKFLRACAVCLLVCTTLAALPHQAWADDAVTAPGPLAGATEAEARDVLALLEELVVVRQQKLDADEVIQKDTQLIATLRSEIDALNMVIALLKQAIEAAKLGMSAAADAMKAKDEVVAAALKARDLEATRADRSEAREESMRKWIWLGPIAGIILALMGGYGVTAAAHALK